MRHFFKKFSHTPLVLGLGAVALAVAVLLSPAKAMAASESYFYGPSSNFNTVVGQNGVFAKPTAFTLASETADARTYTATQSVTCSSKPATSTLTLVAKKTDGSGSLAVDAATASCYTSAPDATIAVADTQAAAKPTVQTAAAGTPATSRPAVKRCDGGVLTWFLCSLYDWILKSIDQIEQNVIVPFLKIDPLVFGDANNPGYAIWQGVRTLANVVFVLAFLVIIFANTLSLSLDSYSLKKTLPKLVAAAILVQFSYLIVGLAIDLTNIVGSGLGDLVMTPFKVAQQTHISNGVAAGLWGVGIAGSISATLALASGVLTGGILFVLIGAFFAVLGVFLTLVARQILVTLLLILSPLAFVAWVLPNTSHYFTMWRKSLTRLLVMYPIVVLLFVSGKIFSTVTVAANGGGAGNDTIRSLISVVAGVIPLFLIPAAFKFAGAALSTVDGLMQTVHGRSRKAFEGSGVYERAKARTDQRRTELASGNKIKFLGSKKLGDAITGNSLTTLTAQGLPGLLSYGADHARASLKGVPYAGSHQDVKAVSDFMKERNAWAKRLEEEGLSFNAYAVLSRGNKWADKEITDLNGKAQTAATSSQTAAQTAANFTAAAQASRQAAQQATAAGNTTLATQLSQTATQQDSEASRQTAISTSQARKHSGFLSEVSSMQGAKLEASRYMGVSAARVAAFKHLSDIDVAGEDDLNALKNYSGMDGGSTVGKLLATQNWEQLKEGARKTNVHLAYKNVDGSIDNTELYKFVQKKNKTAWADYSLDAIHHMAETGILHELAKDEGMRKTLTGATSLEGGPSLAAPQDVLVRKILAETDPDPAVRINGTFSSYNKNTVKTFTKAQKDQSKASADTLDFS